MIQKHFDRTLFFVHFFSVSNLPCHSDLRGFQYWPSPIISHILFRLLFVVEEIWYWRWWKYWFPRTYNKKRTNSLLRKGIIGLYIGFLALVGVEGGLTYGIVEASKDTVIEVCTLFSNSHEPLATNTNEVYVPLGALAFLPDEVASKVKEVSFKSEDGETTHYSAVLGLLVSPSSRVTIKTATEDVLEWSGGNSFTVTLKDGTSWMLGGGCGKCFAVN